MPKTAQNTRIPADLRAIKGMELGEIEKINGLRRDRASIQTRLDNLPAKQKEYEADIQKTKDDEAAIIAAARARTPVPPPPPPPPPPA